MTYDIRRATTPAPCHHCRRPVARMVTSYSPVDYRYRILVECHGETEVMEFDECDMADIEGIEAGMAFAPKAALPPATTAVT